MASEDASIAASPRAAQGRGNGWLAAFDRGLHGSLPGLLVAAVVLAAVPLFVSGDYAYSILVTFAVDLILLVGLNLILGYAQQFSLAHAGFFGLGAYTAGICSARLGWPPLAAFLLAPVVAGVAALVVGLPSLRLRGLYFAMATLGAGMVLFLLFGRAVQLTGGPNGLRGIPRFAVGPLEIGGLEPWYWIAAAFGLLGLYVTRSLLRSPHGRGLRALGISETAAAAVGVDAFRTKLIIFVVTAGYAGVAGAIQAFQARFVGPETFNFFTTVMLVVILMLAGSGTLYGPLVGAALLTGLDESLSANSALSDFKPLLIGLIFLLVLAAFPRGIVGELEAAVGRLAGPSPAARNVAARGGGPKQAAPTASGGEQ